ncbi:MAG: bifunctional demethylmenaquinone methyltransferase/2-methoxy-6-polyprenyl-1,4-benzoquinol methylase UbiE [Planctomycetota bacterium]
MPADPKPTEPAWTDSRLSDPHGDPEKAKRVEQMFAAIAPSYDLNNRVHSFRRDQAWRKAAVRLAQVQPFDEIVDVACGTGDLTIAFADELSRQTQGASPVVFGIDFTQEMLEIAKQKAATSYAQPGFPEDAEQSIKFVHGDAMNLDLPDASVDIVSIAFGIRNVTDPLKALSEFHRVLRPGGRLIVLEFTVPTNSLMRLGYNFYCGWLMPKTATLISGDKSGAYKYLPRSVSTFTGKAELIEAMQTTGFGEVTAKSLTMGIAACYRGVKAG